MTVPRSHPAWSAWPRLSSGRKAISQTNLLVNNEEHIPPSRISSSWSVYSPIHLPSSAKYPLRSFRRRFWISALLTKPVDSWTTGTVLPKRSMTWRPGKCQKLVYDSTRARDDALVRRVRCSLPDHSIFSTSQINASRCLFSAALSARLYLPPELEAAGVDGCCQGRRDRA